MSDPRDPSHIPAREAWAEANLPAWRRDSSGTWGSARCQLPQHGGEDRKPSFRFNLETGGCKCLGCQWEGLVAEYADQCGLPTESLPKFTKEAKEPKRRRQEKLGKEVAWYTYQTTDGHPIYRVVRYEPKDFRLQYWDDGSQRYRMGRNNLPLVPLNLPALAKAPSNQPVLWVEGEKDCQMAAKHLGLLATTTPHGASNFHHLDRKTLEVFRGLWVVLVPDNDAQGRDYMQEVGRALDGIAGLLTVLELPGLEPKGDLSDWIQAAVDPRAEFWQILNSTQCVEFSSAKELLNRVEIKLGNRDLHEVSEEALKALKSWNSPPVLFSRSGGIVRVVVTEDGHLVESVGVDGILGYLSESARWVRYRSESRALVYPDKVAATDLVVRRWDAMPRLTEICYAPTYDVNKRLIRKPGYDPETGIFLDCPLQFPRQIPCGDDNISAARDLLLNEMLGDFPFVDDSSKANCLAAILVPFVRPLLGPTPLHLFESPSAGTGKGLLASIVSIPSTGRSPAVTTGSKDPAEFKKAITSKLMSIPVYLLIDEIQNCLYSDVLASVLTSEIWEDRILGKSRVVEMPNRACWLGAGNNLQIKRDIARRSVWIRMDRGVSNPWRYQDFKRPDIKDWCLKNRQSLTLACLTLCQAWIHAGCPDGPMAIGSFERYSRVIGGILELAKIPGFLANHEVNVQRSDVASEEWEEFVLAWWEEFGSRKVEVSELAKMMESRQLLGGIVANPTAPGRRVGLGKRLAGQVDRVWPCGLTIRIAVLKNEKGIRLYRLERRDPYPLSPDLPPSRDEVSEVVNQVFAGKAIL